MLLGYISKEKIISCFEEFILESMFSEKELDDKVEYAFNLYKNKQIRNLVGNSDEISANVIDGQLYAVELHLDFFEISHCSCNAEGHCEHQLAVLFHLFKGYEDPVALIKKLMGERITLQSFDMQSIYGWLDYFEKVYEQFLYETKLDYQYHYVYNQDYDIFHNLYNTYYPRLLKDELHADPPSVLLFHLLAGLTAFYKMIDMIVSSEVSFLTNRDHHTVIQPLVEEIIEMIQRLSEQEWDEELLRLLEESTDYFGNLLIAGSALDYDRLFLYRLLWSHLLANEKWMEKEANRLQEQLLLEKQKKGKGQHNYVKEFTIARSHLFYMKKEDDAAIAHLDKADASTVYYCTIWVKNLIEGEQWERAEKWIAFVSDKMTAFLIDYTKYQLKQELVSYYLNCFEEYALERNKLDFYTDTLKAWLPYSYPYYSYFLIKEKNFKGWAELQLFVDHPIDAIDKNILQLVDKEAKECLLPLYHKHISDLIEQKNRKSYKDAAKFLRKLRTLYKKLKSEKEWEYFITLLAQRHKRLRAFHEELRKGKGKLIDD